MSPRTVAPAPLDDLRMWRLVLARLHRDSGGSDELFIFGQAVRERVCNGLPPQDEPPPRPESSPKPEAGIIYEEGRVPFPEPADFEALTRRALDVAEEIGGIFAVPLRQLHNCRPMAHLSHEQERGASYKQLAAIGHAVGMTKPERVRWYRISEEIPLSQRHAGHMLSKLKRRAA